MPRMTSIPIDTTGLIEKLKGHGFTEDQALGITEALRDFDQTQLATRSDLKELELRLLVRFGGMLAVAVAFLTALKVYG